MSFSKYYGLEAAQGRASELAAALTKLADRVRQCECCQRVDLLEDAQNPNAFVTRGPLQCRRFRSSTSTRCWIAT